MLNNVLGKRHGINIACFFYDPSWRPDVQARPTIRAKEGANIF